MIRIIFDVNYSQIKLKCEVFKLEITLFVFYFINLKPL